MAERDSRAKKRLGETRVVYRTRRATAQADWRWVEANRERLEEEYAGRWIAVAGQRIVGAGTKLSTAMRQARSAGIERPFVTAFRKAEYRGAFEVPHWL